MDTLAIIKRIDMRLAEIGMSKSEFYEKSGITSASYSHWNTGKFNPTPKKLRSAAECLDVSYEYLVTGAEQTEKAPTSKGEREIGFNDFTYAMQSETQELTEGDKELLLSIARQLNEARKQKNGENH